MGQGHVARLRERASFGVSSAASLPELTRVLAVAGIENRDGEETQDNDDSDSFEA